MCGRMTQSHFKSQTTTNRCSIKKLPASGPNCFLKKNRKLKCFEEVSDRRGGGVSAHSKTNTAWVETSVRWASYVTLMIPAHSLHEWKRVWYETHPGFGMSNTTHTHTHTHKQTDMRGFFWMAEGNLSKCLMHLKPIWKFDINKSKHWEAPAVVCDLLKSSAHSRSM